MNPVSPDNFKNLIIYNLEKKGFNPITNNNGIHIHFKLENHIIDIWPTVNKFKIKKWIRKFKYETYLYANFDLFLEKLEDIRNDLPNL